MLQGKLWGGKWRGQLQDWYLARFLGDDSDVNIATKHPEFNDWKWVDPDQLSFLVRTRTLPNAAALSAKESPAMPDPTTMKS